MRTEGDHTPQALERLQFRRQFFLGPEFLQEFSAWNRINIDGRLRLTVHPDLETHQVTNGNKSITLLGYILDPNNPRASNSDVMDALIGKLDRCNGFWKNTSDFGGRWILVVNDGQDTILFNDAAGLREIYYSRPLPSRMINCASQPRLIAEKLNLAPDQEAVEFIDSRGQDDSEVYWFPGDTSFYEEIKALLPNHCLNLRTGQSCRYWPDADLKDTISRDAVVESLRLLRGFMLSAQHRYSLALSLTAGWDSRMMLALSRDMVRDLYCFTLTYPDKKEETRDVSIPATLLKKLGLKHTVIKYPEQVDAGFKNVLQRNVSAPNMAYCADAQAMDEYYPQNRVCITGDVAEIVKCFYRVPNVKDGGISALDLAALTRIGTHPFLLEAFENWLSSASSYNVPLLDLFCWEQIAGRKQALIRAQYDIVHESFAPLNCRTLLITILSLDEDYRKPSEHRFFRELIEDLWAEVLCVPINPPEKIRMKHLIIGLLDKLRVNQFVPEPVKKLGRRILT